MEADPINDKNNDWYPRWLTFARIVLGLILLAKGISFFHDSTGLEAMMHRKGWDMFDNNAETWAFVINYINLLGGLFIAVGLITRWAAVIQIPILVGAVVFNFEAGLSFSNSELILSLFTLLLLIIFVVKGSGAISAEEFFRSYTKAGMEAGHTKRFFQ